MPVGPTRRAESSTSMPPPLPRSSTTSPSFSSASAVGLPQPSDASTALSGSADVVTASYRSRVIGSVALASEQQDVPQPPANFAPAAARCSASPYFAQTIAFTSDMACIPSRMVDLSSQKKPAQQLQGSAAGSRRAAASDSAARTARSAYRSRKRNQLSRT